MNGSSTAIATMYGGVFTAMSLFSLVFVVLLIIARWKLFAKAGQDGWKSIVPIYSDYVQWKIGWRNTMMFWVYLALGFAGCMMVSFGGGLMSMASGTAPAAPTAMADMTIVIIGTIMILAAYIVYLIAAYKLIRSFGRGIGMFVLFIFFSNIALLVLAFGSASYQGARH